MTVFTFADYDQIIRIQKEGEELQ